MIDAAVPVKGLAPVEVADSRKSSPEWREERVYRACFGAADAIYPLDAAVFESFGMPEPDARWLTHGVLKFAPNETRDTFVYVTSGLSNAWHDDQPDSEGRSGMGCELVLETREDTVLVQVEGQWIRTGLFQGRPFTEAPVFTARFTLARNPNLAANGR